MAHDGGKVVSLTHRPLLPLGNTAGTIVRVIKSRRMRWAGHVARMGEERGVCRVWWGNRRERYHWEDLGVDGLIIL